MPGNLAGVTKPTADKLNSGPSPSVPHMGQSTVRDFVQRLCENFDGISGKFILLEGYTRDSYVVERAIEIQQGQGATG